MSWLPTSLTIGSSTSEESVMSDATQVRPKLKHSSILLETEQGLFVQGEEARGFRLKGKSAVRWITALSPYLTGKYTIAELCTHLNPAQSEQIAQLVRMLLQKIAVGPTGQFEAFCLCELKQVADRQGERR